MTYQKAAQSNRRILVVGSTTARLFHNLLYATLGLLREFESFCGPMEWKFIVRS